MDISIFASRDAVIKVRGNWIWRSFLKMAFYPISSTAAMVVKSKYVPETWMSKQHILTVSL